jgi:Domain of unknown function (DUF4129)
MRRFCWHWSLVVLALFGTVAINAQSVDKITPTEYAAELDRILEATQEFQQDSKLAIALAQHVPDRWLVSVGRDTFSVDGAGLKAELAEIVKNREAIPKFRTHVQLLRHDISAFSHGHSADPSYRRKLDAILSRHEFRDVHGPTWVDKIRQKLLAVLLSILQRIFTSTVLPEVTRWIAWALAALALAVLAAWTYRTLKQGSRLESILPEPLPVSAKQWPLWLAEARAAAASEHWRDGVHLAYWAAISYLEERGTWRPDRARTPREYLKLLAPASEQKPILSALTHDFELVWYGNAAASPQTFAAVLGNLEKLGCPCS